MKNTFLVLGTAVLFLLGTTISSCNGSGEQNQASEEVHEHHEHSDEHEHMEGEHTVMYHCPMKCEGDKTYHEPGNCPVCGIEMKEVEEGDTAEVDHIDKDHDHGNHQH